MKTDNTELTPDPAEHPALTWLRDTYLPGVGNNKTTAAAELGISHKVLNALLAGNYSGNTAAQLAKLDEQRIRLSAQVRVEGVDLAHIPTELMHRCWCAFDAAKQAHLCNYICGKSQIGKTTAAEAYKQRWPETTILMRMPTRPSITALVNELCSACNLAKPRSVTEGMARLRGHLSPRHLIIADEVHLALTRRQGIDALDVLRELYDRSGCGLVLIVTDVGAREITRGPFAERLLQLERRGEWELLPDAPSRGDVRAMWQAYGLPEPDTETQREIGAMARTTCFGQLTHRLKLAVSIAQQEARRITWPDFLAAAARMARRPE